MTENIARIFSFGGGVQSTAALVLAAQGKIDYKIFCFANTGDDSENPDTLRYLEDIHKPFAMKHGLQLVTRQRMRRDGTLRTLYQSCMDDSRTIPLPVYLESGAPGNRKCTVDFKIDVVAKFVREVTRSRKASAVVGIGISLDEFHRAKESQKRFIIHEFPLLDLRLTRRDCANIVRDAGLPVPPKSSCWFCPYKKLSEWQEMATHDPERFELAAKLEAKLEAKRGTLGKDKVYLTRKLVPLKEAILPNDQLKLPLDDDCSGYCWT